MFHHVNLFLTFCGRYSFTVWPSVSTCSVNSAKQNSFLSGHFEMIQHRIATKLSHLAPQVSVVPVKTEKSLCGSSEVRTVRCIEAKQCTWSRNQNFQSGYTESLACQCQFLMFHFRQRLTKEINSSFFKFHSAT